MSRRFRFTSTPRSHRELRRRLCIALLGGLACSAWAVAAGPVSSGVAPAVRIVANRAMALMGDSPTLQAPVDCRVAANRPVVLAFAGDMSAGSRADGILRPAVLEDESWRYCPEDAAPAAPPEDAQYAVASGRDAPPAAAPKFRLASGGDPPPRPPQDAVIASIESPDSQETGRIVISRNSSVAINLKAPVEDVLIGDPTIADIGHTDKPTRIVLTGRSFGTTTLTILSGAQKWNYTISVELDLRQLAATIKAISPTSDVQLRSVNGVIVLMGRVPDADTAARVEDLAAVAQGGQGGVRNQLTVAGVQQTMLRVVVAEVIKDAMRQLGVNWSIGGSDWSRDFFFANNLGQLNPTVFTSSGLANVAAGNNQGGQLTYALGAVGNGVNTNVTFGFPRGEFQLFMNALRQDNLARVLAEPNLVAISGQTATFLAGGEVPIPVTQGGAVAGSITIEYKEFGVRLAFTPTVLGGQIIRLHIMSEVSDAIPGQQIAGGLPVFSFTTRRVESTIECGNGQTFALAGLLREQVRALASRLPGLGDLPVLGTLFSSTSYQKSDTELVVLVTPQLVEPLEPHQVAPPPGSLMTEPSDFELFGMNKLEGTPLSPPEYEGVPRDMVPVNLRPGSAVDWPTSQVALRGPWGHAEFEEN